VRTLKKEGGTKEEEDAAVERVRDVYERAVAQVPPRQEKQHWR
jgi:crooked neck